jgi:hypothetical protein
LRAAECRRNTAAVKSSPRPIAGLLIAAALAIAACAAPTTGSRQPSAGRSTEVPFAAPSSASSAPSAASSLSTAPSRAPVPSALPGLAGWSVVTPNAVEIAVADGSIELTLTRRALWFQGQQGVLVGQPVTGDFRVSATVQATDRTGAPLRDRGDGLVELGGLMARADNAVRENYVFIVVGTDEDGLSVETKSTRDSISHFEGPAWPSSDADLRLCRVGATFTAFKRPAGGHGAWTKAATFDRPDLPETLRVGPNVYSNGRPDLQVTVRDLRIEPISDAASCSRE